MRVLQLATPEVLMFLTLLWLLGMAPHPRPNADHEGRQPDPGPSADTAEEPMPWTESAIYCRSCQFWLRDEEQWDGHVAGKKHKKNLRRAQALAR